MSSHGEERLASELAWRLRQGPGDPRSSPADPTGAGGTWRRAAGASARLLRGLVVDAIPYIHGYKVFFEGLEPPRICTMGVQTSLLATGARQLNTLAPGTPVWVVVPDDRIHGVIVCVEPQPGADPATALCDWLHLTSRCGLHVDKAHEAAFRASGAGNLQDWSAGRPADSLPIGEWGAITETGMRASLDSFMGQFAVDESSGLFLSYFDQFVRLSGVNLELFSAGHVEQFRDDRGETFLYRGWTPYAREQLGALEAGADATASRDGDEVQGSKPYYASLEPKYDDQLPFHRRVFLGGYVGQAGKDLVQVPPPSPAEPYLRASAPHTADELPAAVLEEHRSLAGNYLLRSAGGLHLMKQAAIPAPLQVKRPEDGTGDGEADYKAAGEDGEGSPHKVAAAMGVTDEAHAGLQRAAGLLDEVALRRNWEAEHALAYHEKDWHLPEEEDTPLAGAYEPPPLDEGAAKFALPPPPSARLKVDERYGDVEYHLGESGLHFLEDGSVVIRDAWGSSLVLSQGHIYLDPALDLHVRAGRNVVAWAGRDLHLRARENVEAAASTGSLRLKAESNLHALAGNGGTGGLLLESRGADAYDYKNKVGDDVVSGGIQLKATRGSLVSWSSAAYLRTTAGGRIFLDADQGNGDILQLGQTLTRHCVVGAADHFGSPGQVMASNTYGAIENLLAAPTSVAGGLLVSEGIISRGDINVVQGFVFSDSPSQPVGSYGANSKAASTYKDTVQARVKAMKKASKDASKAYSGALTADFYKDGKPGNSVTIANAAFSFRTTDQYGAGDFVSWEASWQQLLREAAIACDSWSEPPVQAAGKQTAPYPGHKRWAEDTAFYRQPLKLYDVVKGVAKSRKEHRDAYESPEFAAAEQASLDGTYPVIAGRKDASG